MSAGSLGAPVTDIAGIRPARSGPKAGIGVAQVVLLILCLPRPFPSPATLSAAGTAAPAEARVEASAGRTQGRGHGYDGGNHLRDRRVRLWGLMPLYFFLLQPAGAVEIVANRVLWSLLFCALLITITRSWRVLGAAFRNRT